MDLSHFKTFVVAAEESSFRKAAKRLHMSQPPLTRQIQAIEASVGTPLFTRERGKPVSLTAAGVVFLEEARSILASVERAKIKIAQSIEHTQTKLVIANYSSMSLRVLPAYLERMHQFSPEVEVTIRDIAGDPQLRSLMDGSADVGFVADFDLKIDASLEKKAILNAPFVVVFALTHHFAADLNTPIEFTALASERVYVRNCDRAPCYRDRLPEVCRKTGVDPKKLNYVDSLGSLCSLVHADHGVGVVPDMSLSTAQMGLLHRPIKMPMPPYRLYMVKRRASSSPGLDAFLNNVLDLMPTRAHKTEPV